MKGLAISLYCLILVSLTQAKAPFTKTRKFHLSTYWGENVRSNSEPGPSLQSLCEKSPHFEIITLYSVNTHFSSKGKPGMSLSDYCTTPFAGYAANNGSSVLLYCPSVANEIKYCQSLGIKVLIAVVNTNPDTTLKNDNDGIAAANNIWNTFLGGSGDRPFPGVTLDGVELMVRDSNAGYTAFVARLRSLIDKSGKEFYLAASPRCSFPDANIGPVYENLTLTTNPDFIDFLSVSFMSSPDCTYRNTDLFWTALWNWDNWAKSIPNMDVMITLPASEYGGAPGDYIFPKDLAADNVLYQMQQKFPRIKGIAVWDSRLDAENKQCSNALIYSNIMDNLIDLQRNSTVADQCIAPSKTSTTTTVGNAGQTSKVCLYNCDGNAAASNRAGTFLILLPLFLGIFMML